MAKKEELQRELLKVTGGDKDKFLINLKEVAKRGHVRVLVDKSFSTSYDFMVELTLGKCVQHFEIIDVANLRTFKEDFVYFRKHYNGEVETMELKNTGELFLSVVV